MYLVYVNSWLIYHHMSLRARPKNPCSPGNVLSKYIFLLISIALEWTGKIFLIPFVVLTVIMWAQETTSNVWFSYGLSTNSNQSWFSDAYIHMLYRVSVIFNVQCAHRAIVSASVMCTHQHTGAGTKYPPFARRRFQVNIRDWKLFHFDSNFPWHIEAETKWTPFRRRHFQVHFLEWKCMNFD